MCHINTSIVPFLPLREDKGNYKRDEPLFIEIIREMPEPKYVIALGACTIIGRMYGLIVLFGESIS